MADREVNMGEVIGFHDARASLGAEAGDGARAANSVNKSADSPAARPLSERKIGSHQSDGMVERSDHLRTASRVCPISDAISSKESQSATTSRKFETMENDLGHLVLKRKANLSHDGNKDLGQNVLLMPNKREPRSAMVRGICARTKLARVRRGYSQTLMGEKLGVAQGTYKHWERRTAIPRAYEKLFCHETGASLDWLRDNIGNPPLPQAEKPKPGPKKKSGISR